MFNASRVRRVVLAVAAGVLLAAGLAVPGTAANADVPLFSFQNTHTARCIDDSWEYGLRSFPCNGLRYQKFYYISERHGNDGVWVLQNQVTGRCIDDSQPAGLRPIPCNFSHFQLWYASIDSSPSHRNAATSRCIDDSWEYGLRSFPCNGLNFQRFLPVG